MGDHEKEIDAEIEAEKRKISQLFREMKTDSGNDSTLNWMYNNPSEVVDREAYLLGRSVDKALNSLTGREELAQSSFSSNLPKRVIAANSQDSTQVDLQKKIHDDPLYAIRQKEIAFRKQLLNNPLKVKELQILLEAEKRKALRKEKKKKKLKRLSKKNEKVDRQLFQILNRLSSKINLSSLLRDISSSDDSDDEKKKSRKLKKHSTQKGRKRKKAGCSSSSDSDSEDTRKNERKARHPSKSSKRTRRSMDSISSNSPSESDSDDSDSASKTNKKPKKRRERTGREKKSDRYNSDSSFSSDEKRKPKNSSSQHAQSSTDTESESNRSLDRRKKNRRGKSPDSIEDNKHRNPGKKTKKSRESSSSGVDSAPTVKYKESVKKSKSSNRKRAESSATNSKATAENSRSDHQIKTLPAENHDDQSRKKIKSYGLSTLDGSKPDMTSKTVVPYKKLETKRSTYDTSKKVHLTEKEKAAELEEMMKNAKKRKKEREDEYSKHKIDKKNEEKIGDYDDSFVRKHMSTISAQRSMEDRIKSKINTLQRTSGAMEKNFVEK